MTPQEKRLAADRWTGEDCKLNGFPARVAGRLLPFGHVVTDDLNHRAEYSWETIDRIMQTHREFRG